MRATMFAIAGYVEEDSPFYLDWGELRRMMKSRRWDVQEHAGIGHVNVHYDAKGHKGPAYAYRQYTEGEGLESFEEFKTRVRHDILWAKRTMTEQLPGFSPWSFAVPFGNYGHDGDTNDKRIAPFMEKLPRAPLPRGVHDAPARLHDAEEHPLAAAAGSRSTRTRAPTRSTAGCATACPRGRCSASR